MSRGLVRSLQTSSCEGLTFYHVIEEMLGQCELEDLELMAVVAWKI